MCASDSHCKMIGFPIGSHINDTALLVEHGLYRHMPPIVNKHSKWRVCVAVQQQLPLNHILDMHVVVLLHELTCDP